MGTYSDGFDYQSEADKTCSIAWGADKVVREHFIANLKAFAETAAILNIYKKLLFRGKTPDELGMPNPKPGASLEGAFSPEAIDLVHGIVGIATESGEAVEIILDKLISDEAFDRVNAVEEMGDLRWYINRVLRWADVTDEECERANIAKLHGRGFAFGFNQDADSNRDLSNERAILEDKTRKTLFE